MHSVYVILILALVVLLAQTHTARHMRLPKPLRPAVAGGLGYLLLGWAGGPQVTGLIGFEALSDLDPLFNLAIGWVGLLLGLQLKIADLKQITPREVTGSLLHFLVVSGLAFAGLFPLFLKIAPADALGASLILSLIAGASSPTFVLLIEGKDMAREAAGRRMLLYANLSCLYAVLFNGLVVVIFFPQPDLAGWLPAAPLRVLFSIGLAAVLAFLFHFFMSHGAANRRLALLLIGMMVFCGGVAAVTQVPPLFLNLLVGAWLVNQARHGNRLYHFLVVYERPLFLTLIVVAGLVWEPGPGLLPALAAFVVLRTLAIGLARQADNRLWPAASGKKGAGQGVPLLTLLPQGGVALAIAISQWQQHTAGRELIPAVAVPAVLLFALLAGFGSRGDGKKDEG